MMTTEPKEDRRVTRWQTTAEERAKQAVIRKIINRELWRKNSRVWDASSFECYACYKQARHMHHCSYHPEDAFCTVPLCASCHAAIHNGKLHLTFGVVPTRVGLIRIAIADGAPTP